jgi:hypothetical protein
MLSGRKTFERKQLSLLYTGTEDYSRLDQVWKDGRFSNETLANQARNYFTEESLEARQPVPREFQVVVYGWGLPLYSGLMSKLRQVQDEFNQVLGGIVTYNVKPHNLGTELFRVKMPDDKISEDDIETSKAVAAAILRETKAFQILYKGVGVTPEGVLVVPGFDPTGSVDYLREQFALEMPYASPHQIPWKHIPLGRITEPVDDVHFGQLRNWVANHKENFLGNPIITRIKLDRETQWYGEKKQIVLELPLSTENLI